MCVVVKSNYNLKSLICSNNSPHQKEDPKPTNKQKAPPKKLTIKENFYSIKITQHVEF